MHAQAMIIAIALAFSPASNAEGKKEEVRFGAYPLKGDYYLYGGTLGEMTPPTPRDRKISLMLTGALAKDLFHEIGPDLKDACSSDGGYRERRRGDLNCTYTKVDGYECYIGIDVRNGKSMNGSIC